MSDLTCQIQFIRGNFRQIVLASPEDTIVRAALRGGLIIPTGCRHGFCGTCEVVVQKGPQPGMVRACVSLVSLEMRVILAPDSS